MSRDKRQYLFVSGVSPRSGTTLLELVLDAHPAISISPECYCMQHFFRKKNKILSKQELHNSVLLIKNDSKLNAWPNFNCEKLIKKISAKDAARYDDLLYEILDAYSAGNKKNSIIYGNKRGFYALGGFAYAKKYFPYAKCIYIYRDPRDIINSIIKNRINNFDTQGAIVDIMIRNYNIAKMKKKYQDDICIINYENLVTMPHRVCREICSFLNIEFDKSMMEFHVKNKNGAKLIAPTKGIHSNTTSTFNPKLIGQWKNSDALSTRDIILIESILNSIFRKFNYAMNQNEIRIFGTGFTGVLIILRFSIYKILAKLRNLVHQL